MKRGTKPRDPETFFRQSYQVAENGCWLWTGPIDRRWGYGLLNIGTNGRVRASRFSLRLATGENGDGLFACHSCDQPRCVNPDHLFWGTQKDNMRDASAKGRMHNNFQASKTHCPQGHPYTDKRSGYDGSRVCLICQREANRRYRERNPDKERARRRKYVAENYDQVKANAQASYWANLEKMRAKNRASYHATKRTKP